MARKKKISENELMNDWYLDNNIEKKRNQNHARFFYSLFSLMNKTYLGRDVLNDTDEYFKHYEWCFKEINKDKPLYPTESALFDYLWLFFLVSFYMQRDDKTKDVFAFFDNQFDLNRMKSNSEREMFLFLYDLFEKSQITNIKKEENE